MKLITLILTLVSFSCLAQAQNYSLRQTNMSYLRPPRADMPPAIFAAHAAFVEFARSARSLEIIDASATAKQIVLHSETGGITTFHATKSQGVFEHNIAGTALEAYPEGRLMLFFKLLSPKVDSPDNPILTASIYIVGKYQFAHWGYGDVETHRIYSEASWIKLSHKLIETREDDSHCDPRFPCDPKIAYIYEGNFQNSQTGEKITITQVLNRRI